MESSMLKERGKKKEWLHYPYWKDAKKEEEQLSKYLDKKFLYLIEWCTYKLNWQRNCFASKTNIVS